MPLARALTLTLALSTSATAAEGWHFSLGVGGMVQPTGNGSPSTVAGLVALQPALAYGWSRVEVHVTLQLLGYLSSFPAAFAALDAQVRVNLTDHFALGAGPYVGAAFSWEPELLLGASLSPAIVRLGPRGEHELSAWVAMPFLWANPRAVIGLVSYAYVF